MGRSLPRVVCSSGLERRERRGLVGVWFTVSRLLGLIPFARCASLGNGNPDDKRGDARKRSKSGHDLDHGRLNELDVLVMSGMELKK